MNSNALTRQEKGRIKKYLISIYRNRNFPKEENTLCSENIILDLISAVEENKILSKTDIQNLKINLDGALIYGLENIKDSINYIARDKIFNSAYKKLIEIMKAEKVE
ncbi:hypothetical protein [Clostridium beijerinckii]|uniref:Uncharacterized protein n=1 Tax=Clostridium beijerinckii TaxID=1520 RepID=A0AAE5H7R8_CLOBE|nr:hypothetical protein [Clostridium beijerinckii]NOW85325.1 hypothetical protein [Clostridium beijerinckii]NSB16472.1 hypothetical protein [Clostridium beijerinckii]OOM25677.1 hypothetical protein CLOBE_34720 [Clostridium beijerinckii]